MTMSWSIIKPCRGLVFDMSYVKKAKTKDTRANISTLKVHLGRFLKKVKAGAEVVILDRQHPVAKIIPFYEGKDTLIEHAAPARWADVKQQLQANHREYKVLRLKKNSLFYLDEDRGT